MARDEQEVFLLGAVHGTFWEWPDGEHAGYDHAAERDAMTADWFADALGATAGPDPADRYTRFVDG